MSVVSTPGILLRSFAYGETSLILRFYTRDLGVVGVMAKGARRSRRGADSLETFATGTLTVYLKDTRDLQTLKEFDARRSRRRLSTPLLRFAGASVLGEIVLRHAGEEGNPHLYDRLEDGLDRVEGWEEGRLAAGILAEGWGLVAALGYRPVLEACVECGQMLDADENLARFDFGAGGLRCAPCGGSGPRIGPGARAQLLDLLAGRLPGTLRRPRAHARLLSDFVTYHVSMTRPLDSFRILTALLPRGEAGGEGAGEDAGGESMPDADVIEESAPEGEAPGEERRA